MVTRCALIRVRESTRYFAKSQSQNGRLSQNQSGRPLLALALKGSAETYQLARNGFRSAQASKRGGGETNSIGAHCICFEAFN